MLRWWWQLAGLICALCAVLVGVVQAYPLAAAQADTPQAFLYSPNCTLPCWEGIQPGVTTSAQAVALLNRHPWVDRVWGVSNGRWSWSGTQPDWIDAQRPGTMSTRYGIVDQIGIPTRLTTGDFWLMYNQLDKGVVFTAGLSSMVYNFADAGDFWIMSHLRCPITRSDFWNAPVLILLGDMSEFEQQYDDEQTDYAAPGWSRGISC